MANKVRKLVALSLLLVLLSALTPILNANSSADEGKLEEYEVIWQGDHEAEHI